MNTELNALLHQVKAFPYGRNSNRSDFTLVPLEKKGSCSTKHAYIKSEAEKNNWKEVKLILCIYMMNEKNTSGVGGVLSSYGLLEIPEAHTYLEVDGSLVDITGLGDSASSFLETLVKKEEIQPDQIGDYKINWHKDYLKIWAAQTDYTPAEIWEIREKCIQALSEIG